MKNNKRNLFGILLLVLTLTLAGFEFTNFSKKASADTPVQPATVVSTTAGSVFNFGPLSFSLPWTGIANTTQRLSGISINVSKNLINLNIQKINPSADKSKLCANSPTKDFKTASIGGFYCVEGGFARVYFKDSAGRDFSMLVTPITQEGITVLLNSLQSSAAYKNPVFSKTFVSNYKKGYQSLTSAVNLYKQSRTAFSKGDKKAAETRNSAAISTLNNLKKTNPLQKTIASNASFEGLFDKDPYTNALYIYSYNLLYGAGTTCLATTSFNTSVFWKKSTTNAYEQQCYNALKQAGELIKS